MELRNIIAVVLLKVLGAHCLSPPDLVSSWYDMEAYVTPEITIPHNFGELPMRIDVQVKITDANLGDVIFLASGSAQISDDASAHFGGVIYIYDTMSVKIIGPGPIGCSSNCNGGLVYLGGSNFLGPTPATPDGLYKTAKVRVRAWKTCTFVRPSSVSAEIPIANIPSEDLFHSIDVDSPDLVYVKVKLDNGWMMDGQGMASYSDTTSPLGGVLFAYDKKAVKVWIANEGSSDTNGLVFSAIGGWGNDGNYMSAVNGSFRVFAWAFVDLEKSPEVKLNVFYKGEGYSDEQVQPLEMDVTTDTNILIIETSPPTSSDNYLLSFPVSGSAMTSGSVSTGYFGSVFYGFNSTHALFWRPVSTGSGCAILVDGLWGKGNEDRIKECSKKVKITMRYFLATYDELPCGVLGCSGLEIGPMCACGGTGFEGQYCTSRVPCTKPRYNREYKNADFAPSRYSYVFEDFVLFTCKTGYSYTSGTQNQSCNAYKAWEGDKYVCDPLPCPQPESPINADVIGTIQAYYQGTVNYECHEGKDVQTGNLTRTCQADQTWSGEQLVCIGSCGEPPAVEAYRTNFGTTYNVTATYACNVGHEYYSGDMSRTCQINGNWTGTPPTCVRVSCPAPVDGIKSQVSYNTTFYQDEALYTCDLGYISNSRTSRSLTCEANKLWSEGPVECQKIDCGYPGTPVNAYLDSTASDLSMEYLSVQTYKCQTGYLLDTGGLRLECLADGDWSDTIAVCTPIQCSTPANVSGAALIVTGTGYMDQVVAVCVDGHVIKSGSPVRYCNETGQWSGTEPVCQYAVVKFVDQPVFYNGSQSTNSDFQSALLNLLINPNSTNKYRRSLRSTWDDQLSHLIIGVSGLFILLAVCGYICLLDFIKHVRVNGKVQVIQGQDVPQSVGNDAKTSDKSAEKNKKKPNKKKP